MKSIAIAVAVATVLSARAAEAHGPVTPRYVSASATGVAAGNSSQVASSQAATGGSVLAEASRWIGSRNMTGMAGPWCADAVSFWLRRSGHRPLANRMVASALAYGPRLSGPRVGALAVIRTWRGAAGHVGLVEGIEPDGSIRLISGNWGHRVAQSVVARRTVLAFVEVP